jgi:SAM-dependent methyltransferase
MDIELNGDVPLSAGDRIRYLWRNARRNMATLLRGPSTRPFVPNLQEADAAIAGQSPGRLVTELFIDAELPKLLSIGSLDVVELGCGSGAMAFRLAKLGYRGRYTGVDVQDRFRHDHPANFPFQVNCRIIDAHRFEPSGPIDFMISQSTLEHIAQDGELIGRLSAFFKRGGLELHVVPSGAALLAYLWHGYRQYTPAALACRFGPRIEIVRLGGFGSYMLHVVFITGPEMILHVSLRKAAPRVYRALLRLALRIDRAFPVCPTAYAVIRRH